MVVVWDSVGRMVVVLENKGLCIHLVIFINNWRGFDRWEGALYYISEGNIYFLIEN